MAAFWKVGDRVVLPYCDVPENQGIIGEVVTVVTAPQPHSPNWMDVERAGIIYSVRGAECRPVPADATIFYRDLLPCECDVAYAGGRACPRHK